MYNIAIMEGFLKNLGIFFFFIYGRFKLFAKLNLYALTEMK